MTRLLWLTPEVPEPGGSGGAMRSFHLLKGVRRAGLEPVVVAPSSREQAERAVATEAIGIELALVPRPARQSREALTAVLRAPAVAGAVAARPWLGAQADVFWTAMAGTVERELERGPRAVVVEHDFCMRWALHVPLGIPAGLVSHNAVWVQLARDARAAGGVRGAALALEAWRYRRLVAGAVGRYTWWSAVSEPDVQAFRALGAGSVGLAPNGADVGALSGVPVGGGEAGRLLFCGTLSYPPNADAVRWLITAILPRVLEVEPGARLTVIGRGAPPDVERLAVDHHAVDLLGWVDDLAPHFAASAVFVAGLRSGGGTRLKVVEALAAGRATVATTIGAEGLELEDGVHLVIADEPDRFAEEVVRLLGDPKERARLGGAGRSCVRDRYDWTGIADAFAESLGTWVRAT